MYYFLVIFIGMLLIYAYTIPLAIFTNFYTLAEALIGPFFVNASTLILLGVECIILRTCVPKKFYSYNNKFFKVNEKCFLITKKLKVQKWKDKVPEMGKTSNFPKDKIYSTKTPYLKKFLHESCFAEFLHIVVIITQFALLFFMRVNSYLYAIPILLVSTYLHILPCIIQRFVRFKLVRIYEKKLELENKHIIEC